MLELESRKVLRDALSKEIPEVIKCCGSRCENRDGALAVKKIFLRSGTHHDWDQGEATLTV